MSGPHSTWTSLKPLVKPTSFVWLVMFMSHIHVQIPGCSVHPLSDWLCLCLTCINYWVEYASLDWLWGLCLTCKSKTKYWVKQASFVWLVMFVSHMYNSLASVWLAMRFVSHIYKLLAGACIICLTEKKSQNTAESPHQKTALQPFKFPHHSKAVNQGHYVAFTH